MHESFHALFDLIIQDGVAEYFKLVSHTKENRVIRIYLEEINSIPQEYQGNKLQSKGFFNEVVLQDFPMRGNDVFLHVKRRRWLNLDTGEVVFRNWELVAKGTRITTDFAAFLKGISRY